MNRFRRLCLSCFLLLPVAALAGNDKVDPASYICAELVSQPVTDGQPPVFTAMQMDGFAAAVLGNTVADPASLAPALETAYQICQTKPADKVLDIWKEVRKRMPAPAKGESGDDGNKTVWRADTAKCADYNANQEDGSGFAVWLDGYNRGKKGISASILNDDEVFQAFFAACAKKPEALMLDVLAETAR